MTTQHIMPRRSPLHPSALRLNDITVGRSIIWQNVVIGLVCEAVILTRPYVGRPGPRFEFAEDRSRQSVVRLRTADGTVFVESLAEMGVMPYRGYDWNSVNFIIDARKRDLLRVHTAGLWSYRDFDDLGFDEEEEEEE